jgi:hypothetical protein
VCLYEGYGLHKSSEKRNYPQMYSANMKTKFITTTTIAVLAIIVTTTTTATSVPVKASNNNNDNDNDNCAEKSVLAELACEGQGIVKSYNQGVADGRQAAFDGKSNECPESDSLSGYCLGFGTGWNRVNYAQKELNRDNGNREDDGEFVDTPKRIIGED